MAGLSPQVVDSCLGASDGCGRVGSPPLVSRGGIADSVRARGGRGDYGLCEGRSPLCDAIVSHSLLLEASVWPRLPLQVNSVLSEGSP